jgi:hypothetical protein
MIFRSDLAGIDHKSFMEPKDALLFDIDRDFQLRRSLGDLVRKVNAPIACHIRREMCPVIPNPIISSGVDEIN